MTSVRARASASNAAVSSALCPEPTTTTEAPEKRSKLV